jgi:hypothetical protein
MVEKPSTVRDFIALRTMKHRRKELPFEQIQHTARHGLGASAILDNTEEYKCIDQGVGRGGSFYTLQSSPILA